MDENSLEDTRSQTSVKRYGIIDSTHQAYHSTNMNYLKQGEKYMKNS